MSSINWNDMSKLGLIERINTEILHPLGLSLTRTPETGISDKILIADDGVWEYPESRKSLIISNDEIIKKLKEMK